ncbi:hypothetical protein PR048_016467 [Dryococelus australis]|uniref:RNA-directed DNA polymerase n=1 Tax=Dryococelus australis TaxID=614101 RepID=A0ABQ9HJT1_9NEOP|nr:hypothetical protein PR048_016467 [Dryococelus australis]
MVAAIVDMPHPKSAEDVRRFLGMVTYYYRFIHESSTITTSLRHFLCKNTIIKWAFAHEAAFLNLKQANASDQVHVPHDPDLPVQLACDASSTGIAEGIENSNVDCLSRAPININSYTANAINNEVKQLCDATIEQIGIPTVTHQLLKEETKNDAILSTIMKSLQEENTSEPDYIENGILFRGQHIVVPASLQSAVLNKLHRTHVGITKMKQLAYRYVYWKKIDSDIEQLVRSCSECVAINKSPAKAPSHPWERSTSLSDGKSPAEQYLNRQIRIKLNAMRPIKFHDSPSPTQPAHQFSEGERVSTKYYSNNKSNWKCGKVLKKLGKLHYLEELDNGFHFKRHID